MPSPYLQTAFNASGTQFAAVFAALNCHRLRVSPVISTQPAQEFQFDANIKITTLLWSGVVDQTINSKKRKKQTGSHADTEVIVLGTSTGQILVYSPASNSIINKYVEFGTVQVASLCTRTPGVVAALFADQTLVDIDLNTGANSTGTAPVDGVCMLSFNSQLIIANTAPHLVADGEVRTSFMGFASNIKQLVSIDSHHFAAVAEDRQILVYNIKNPAPVNTLVCPSVSAVSISVSIDAEGLAAVTEDGQVHVFSDILTPMSDKSGKKGRAFAHSTPKFAIDVNVSGKHVLVQLTKFADDFLTLVWPEQGTVPVFDRVKWRDDGVRTEPLVLNRDAAAPLAHENLVEGRDPATAPAYAETSASIVSGENVAHLSDDETLADRLDALEKTAQPKQKQTTTSQTLRSRRTDLQQQLEQPGTFATVLSQALTMNDKQLVEICLEEKNTTTIRTSIAKLEPQRAAALLEHLATTMARSQNRSDTLLQWVRYTVVIHGGYLVTVPNLLKTLASLHSALTAKAAALPKLLSLLGRLELLEEQLEVRDLEGTVAHTSSLEPQIVYDESEVVIVNGEEAGDSDMSE